jgi:asparagine synthetase B (glutamine-hydrolysing)
MCGYYYSYNIPIRTVSNSILLRGPEQFNKLDVENEHFGHALLSTQGTSPQQPIQNKHGTLVYNGSTYNSNDNDTDWIIRNLDDRLETTVDLIKSLIGEYSVTYVTDTHIVFAVDQWSSKNLFFYYNRETRSFIAGSTVDFVRDHAPSAVRAQENRIYTIDKHTFELEIQTTTEWNLTQTVHNYDSVFETFEQAIKDRHEPNITTYLLSSGIDVGVIVCCARKFFNADMFTVSKIGREDPEILAKRMRLQNKPLIERADDSAVIPTTEEMYKRYGFEYTYSSTARATSAILQNHFVPRKQKILISGIGGDELYDDYQPDKTAFGRVGKIIGGWPSDLRTIYPWHDYADSRLHRQIHRSDMVCGHHGIEGRYPLTDQRLFQHFLNTTVELKNRGYKNWQVQYMKEHDYPITLNKTRFTS